MRKEKFSGCGGALGNCDCAPAFANTAKVFLRIKRRAKGGRKRREARERKILKKGKYAQRGNRGGGKEARERSNRGKGGRNLKGKFSGKGRRSAKGGIAGKRGAKENNRGGEGQCAKKNFPVAAGPESQRKFLMRARKNRSRILHAHCDSKIFLQNVSERIGKMGGVSQMPLR